MTQTMKWIMALGLALIVGAGLVGMAESWRQVSASAATVRQLQQEGTVLSESLARAQAAQRDMAEWGRLRVAAR